MRSPEELRAALIAIDQKRWYPREPEWPAAPWLFTAGSQEWAIATEGHVLLAIRRELVAGDCLPAPEKVAALTRQWVGFTSANPVRVAAHTLTDFARVGEVTEKCDRCENTREVECPNCDGDGTRECECSECGDSHTADCDCKDGMIDCPDCSEDSDEIPVQVLSSVLNRDKLRYLLEAAPLDEGEIDLSIEPASKQKDAFPLFLLRPTTEPSWMAVIMSMSPHVKPKERLELPQTTDAVDPVPANSSGTSTREKT